MENSEALKRTAWIACLVDDTDLAEWLLRDQDITLDELRSQTIAITADDIFKVFTKESGETGCLPEHIHFWEYFDRVITALRANNQPVDQYLFERKIKDTTETLLTYGIAGGYTNTIFNPALWRGYDDDVWPVFLLLDDEKRKKINIEAIRKAVAEASGKIYRNEILDKAFGQANLKRVEVIRAGNVVAYANILESLNWEPHPNDIFVPAMDSGQSNFYLTTQAEHFKTWMKFFSQRGVDVPVEHIYKRYGRNTSTLLESHTWLEKIFHPAIWVGRLNDMLTVWSNVPDDKKNNINFAIFYSEAEDDSHHFPYAIDENLTKEMLLAPIHTPGCPNDYPAAATKTFWENFEHIQAVLERHDSPLTLEDLYRPVGLAGESLILKAAYHGHLFEALSLVDPSKGIYLSYEECTKLSPLKRSLLSVATDRYQLDELLSPSLWVGQAGVMARLWEEAPKGHGRNHVTNFGETLAQTNRNSLIDARRRLNRNTRLRP